MPEIIRTPMVTSLAVAKRLRERGLAPGHESGTLDPGPMQFLPPPPELDRALISEIAMDVGKELVAYLEVQYPDVFKAMNSGCKLSIRNHVHNDIMAAIETTKADEIRARLDRRRKERRDWLRRWRRIREMGEPATEDDRAWLARELERGRFGQDFSE